MLNLLLTSVFVVLFLFLGYVAFRLASQAEVGWKFCYIGVSAIIVFSISMLGVSSLLNYLLRDFIAWDEFFMVRDTNTFVALLVRLAIFSTLLLIIPAIVLFLYLYLSSSLTVSEKQQLSIVYTVFVYLYLIIFIIVDRDLSLSSWDVMLAADNLPEQLQLQPDLDFLFLSFWGEWLDFMFLVFLESFVFVLFYQGYFISVWRQPRVHFFFLAAHVLFIFYCFCGEGFFFDVYLLVFSVVLFEVLFYQLRLFYFLKTKHATI